MEQIINETDLHQQIKMCILQNSSAYNIKGQRYTTLCK